MRATLPERYRHGVVRAALDQHVTGIGEHRRERGRGLPAGWARLLRRGPDAFVGQLQGSGGTLSQGQLLEMAASIGLVGLQQSGVAFV